jgi:hypothetical protein
VGRHGDQVGTNGWNLAELLGDDPQQLDPRREAAGQVLGNERVREGCAAVLLDIVYTALRERGATSTEV